VEGGKYKLDRAISASGARYTGKDLQIWDKGGNAALEYKGKSYSCKVIEDK
jgi:membrane-bound inhibitor of C-type lysozyme